MEIIYKREDYLNKIRGFYNDTMKKDYNVKIWQIIIIKIASNVKKSLKVLEKCKKVCIIILTNEKSYNIM